MDNKLLTIGVPTYNRAAYLKRCLCELLAQCEPYTELLEIQVADNCSTDNTEEVVADFIEVGHQINYYKQPENLGMDGNFIYLYNQCTTKYMWMLSDDDYLLPGAFSKIINLLQQVNAGVIYLNNIWFDEKLDESRVKASQLGEYTRYDDPILFVDRVNYWFTFISGNIVNKSVVADKIKPEKLKGTFLALLGWIIPAAFQQLPNYVIEDHILACKGNNTGGYKLFQVFGKNFSAVMDILIERGCDKKIKRIINNHLLNTFFPMFLTKANINFKKEKYLPSLLPVFWSYRLFWKKIFPPLVKQNFQR